MGFEPLEPPSRRSDCFMILPWPLSALAHGVRTPWTAVAPFWLLHDPHPGFARGQSVVCM